MGIIVFALDAKEGPMVGKEDGVVDGDEVDGVNDGKLVGIALGVTEGTFVGVAVDMLEEDCVGS